MRALVLFAASCGVTSLDVREPAAPSTSATPFTIGDFALRAQGDVVLVFYRGHW